MAVHGEDRLVAVGDVFHEILDELLHLRRGGIAHGIGDVHGSSSRADGGVDHLHKEIPVGACGVLGGKLDVRAVFLCVGGHRRGGFQHLVRGHLELVLHVEGARGDEEVDAGIRGLFHRVPGSVDVQDVGTCKRGDGTIPDGAGDGLYGLIVSGGGDGEACLDDVDLHLLEAFCDLDLLLKVHGAAGGLLAVSQRGVENYDLIHENDSNS